MTTSGNSSLYGKWALWGFVVGVLGSVALAALSVQAGGVFGAWLLRAAGVFAGACLAFTVSFGIDGWRHTTGKVAVIGWALCIVVLLVFRTEIKFLIRPSWARMAPRKVSEQTANPAAVSLPAEKPAPSVAQPAPAAPKPVDVETVDLGGGVKMELVWVPAGSFQMGGDKYYHEKPVHTVELDGFWMGKTEVTREQYKAVMGKNPSQFKAGFFKSKMLPKNPVEMVSWNDATEFCRKLGGGASPLPLRGRDGPAPGVFRLPTEAEWEYACRAGSTTRFSFGDSDSGVGDYAWHALNSGRKTHPVGEKKPNDWGLYDMHGNVLEWCADWFGEKYYGESDRKNPQGPSSGEYRVARGGSWDCFGDFLHSSCRVRYTPSRTQGDHGFRVVCGGVSSR